MANEPKGGSLPAIAVGVLAIGCCLGPAFAGSAVAGLLGWFDGLRLGEAAALALLTAFLVYLAIRLWRARRAPGTEASPVSIDNDGRRQ